MPKLLYILFLLVLLCRIMVMAGPLIQTSSVVLMEWYDTEDESEEEKAEKPKYESKEENWFCEIAFTDYLRANLEFIHLPHTRLLSRTTRPAIPPPNAA